jgi:hypothetical protein
MTEERPHNIKHKEKREIIITMHEDEVGTVRCLLITKGNNRICIIKILIYNELVLYNRNSNLSGITQCRTRDLQSDPPYIKL